MPHLLRYVSTLLILGLILTACDEPEDQADDAMDAPAKDIYLTSFSTADGVVEIGDLQNITDREGYDNQPFFVPDSDAFLYTSMREGKTDIFRYDLSEEQHDQLTRTEATSEYSPTPMTDGYFSVVRVEEDGTQRLWRFSVDGGEPELMLQHVEPVGYHAWIDADRLALFVLGEPPTLQLADLGLGDAEVVTEDIGPSLQPVPDAEAVTFVQQHADTPAQLMRFDPAADAPEPIIELVEGGEDHTWTPDGLLLMTSGSVLYSYDPDAGDASWQEVADLAPLQLSRIAVSPDAAWLAIVAEE